MCLLAAVVSLFVAPAAQARILFDAAGVETSTVPMTRLPTWVQVSSAAAALYTTDAGLTLAGSKLARNTFLRVLGGGTSRLQVDAYDENGAQAQRGWIDADYVLPSAPGTDWLVSSTATPLWRTDGAADTLRSIDRFTPLQRVDGPVGNRIQVRVYRSDFSMLDQGWVDVADAGSALPPQTRVPSPTGERNPAARTLSGPNLQQAFIEATALAARTAAAQTGVPASVTVAQAILESDWGRSLLAQNANNYFGMKAMGTLGTDGVVWMPTSEYDDSGELYHTVSAFRAYRSLAESLTDHDRLLQTASRYAAAMRAAGNPQEFASRLYEAGYSTDPQYADKLVALMDRYNLYSLDA
jgi:hypothetical protein